MRHLVQPVWPPAVADLASQLADSQFATNPPPFSGEERRLSGWLLESLVCPAPQARNQYLCISLQPLFNLPLPRSFSGFDVFQVFFRNRK